MPRPAGAQAKTDAPERGADMYGMSASDRRVSQDSVGHSWEAVRPLRSNSRRREPLECGEHIGWRLREIEPMLGHVNVSESNPRVSGELSPALDQHGVFDFDRSAVPTGARMRVSCAARL